LVNEGALALGQFIAGESSNVHQGQQEFVPSVRQGRRHRITAQNCAKRPKASAVAPGIDKLANGVEKLVQFLFVAHF
jgi:hypothetical protein